MPLEKIEPISEERAWALWKITESLEELMALLKPEGSDLVWLDKIHNPEKKREWLASRLALKALVTNVGEKYMGAYCDEHGKPYLNNYPFSISISHSKAIATAILCKKAPVGIDTELVSPKMNHVVPRVLNNSELALSLNQTLRLCVYWSVKEVIYKLYGKRKISLRDNIFVHPFTLDNEGICKAELNFEGIKTVYTVRYLKVENHLIAYNL